MPKSATRAIAFNTAVQIAGRVVVLAIAAVSVAVLTRYLGPADYGKFTISLVYLQFFGILADVGLFTIAVREMSRRPKEMATIAGNIFMLRLVLSLVVLGIAALISVFLPYTPDVRLAILIAGSAILFGLMNSSLVTIFQTKLRMQYSVLSDTVGRILSFGAVVLVAALDLGFYAAVATAAVGALGTLVVSLYFARRMVRLRPLFNWRIWKRLFLMSVPLGIALALNQFYFRIDTIMLSFFRSYQEVGAYSLAYKLLEILLTVPGFFLNSVFPILSRYVADNDTRVRRTVQMSFNFLLILGVPVAVGGAILSRPIIELIGGSQYLSASVPLKFLLAAAALSFLNTLGGYLLVAKDKLRLILAATVSGLSINIILNLIFIPRYGMTAAAINTLVSEVIVFAVQYWLIRRHYGFNLGLRLLPKVLLASAAMGLLVWPLQEVPVLLTATLGGLVYGGLLYALKGIDPGVLRQLTRRSKP